MVMDLKTYLQELYYNPKNPASFSGIDRLWRVVREKKNSKM